MLKIYKAWKYLQVIIKSLIFCFARFKSDEWAQKQTTFPQYSFNKIETNVDFGFANINIFSSFIKIGKKFGADLSISTSC